MARAVYKAGAVVLAASFLGNAFSYLFHLASARMLGPAPYGELVALFSLIAILATPYPAVQAIVTKYAAQYRAKGAGGRILRLLSNYFFLLLAYGIAVLAVLVVFAGPIGGALHIADWSLLALTGLGVLFMALVVPPQAVLNGLERFRSFSAILFLNPFLKFALAVGLIVAGLGVAGALFSVSLAGVVVLVLSVAFLGRSFFAAKKQDIPFKKTLAYSAAALVAFWCFAMYFNVDVLFVKHFFSSEQTGFYGVASQLGKIIFFLTSALAFVLLPKVSGAHARGVSHRGALYKSLGFVAAVSALVWLLYVFFPAPAIGLLFGAAYVRSATPLLAVLGAGVAFYALSHLLVYYFISIGRKWFVAILLAFLALETGLMSVWHGSPLQIAWALFASMGFLFIALFAYSFFDRKVAPVEA